jgi:hypothetical protein
MRSISTSKHIPTYDEIMKGGKELQKEISPQHNDEKGAAFYGLKTADKPISRMMYYATVWILHNGFKDPLYTVSALSENGGCFRRLGPGGFW